MRVHIRQLETDGTLDCYKDFSGGSFKVENNPTESSRTRNNETIKWMVYSRNCFDPSPHENYVMTYDQFRHQKTALIDNTMQL